MIRKISIDCDLTPLAVDSAVYQFVGAFGKWPNALVASSDADSAAAKEQATALGLAVYVLPQAIALKDCAWAICGEAGETIWSPGA